MTREERENALHCLKVMVDEEVCEECKLYGTTGTDHCEADCVRVAIETLKKEPRKGQWIIDGHHRKCPNCGEYFCIKDAEGNEIPSSFCPNCGADMAIEALNQRWIPVTERLPEEGYSVLVMRITDENYKYMRVATYQGDCWMDNTDKFNKPNPHKVIAWMPLPQPYKAESEVEDRNDD